MVNLASDLTHLGATLRFSDSGASETNVVFTHGAGVDHAMFEHQVSAAIGAGHRVITWDLRGHGESTLEDGIRFRAEDAIADLLTLIEHLDLQHPVLVGHSLGGNLSQEVVRRYPDLCGGLIIVDSAWNAGPLSLGERAALRIAAPLLALVPASRLPALMAGASATTPTGVEYARHRFARMPKRVFLDVWRATLSLVHPDAAYRTPVPLTLIRGERDSTGNIAMSMPRWASTEGVREHVIASAGHIAPVDAPDEVSTTILSAVRETR